MSHFFKGGSSRLQFKLISIGLFANRSHREGPLGSVFNQDGDDLAGGVAGYRQLHRQSAVALRSVVLF